MYNRAAAIIAPAISRQQGRPFIAPDREQIKAALGKERPTISHRARSAFLDGLARFFTQTRGKRALITPSPSTHHSAQFPAGTFEISLETAQVSLRDDRGPRRPARSLHKISFWGAEAPVYIENLQIPADQIKFVILRPKLGRLGMPSVTRWEILVSRQDIGWVVDHTDSDLNPKWAGVI